MKNISIFGWILLLFFFVSCKQNADSYKVTGEISGLKDGDKIELIPGATGGRELPVAEGIAKGGRFALSGTLDEPRLFYLSCDSISNQIPIMLENADVKLKARIEFEEHYGRRYRMFHDIEIKGSKVHDLFAQKTSFIDSFSQRSIDYMKLYDETLKALVQAQKLRQTDQIDSIRNTENFKKFLGGIDAISQEQKLRTEQIAELNKESFWGPLVILASGKVTQEYQNVYNSFSQNAKDSYYGKLLRKLVYPDKLVGNSAPLFSLPDKDGKLQAVSSLMEGKKCIIIDFWASWCHPCREEIPNLKKIYDEFSSKGLQIISVSIDIDKEKWLKALSEENMPWPNLSDSEGIGKKYQVRAIPKLFLLNDKGIVIADDLRGESLTNKLKEIFK